MLDLNICSFKELIECAFGDPENNAVNFKVIQTILYLLARQLGVLDRLVQVDFVTERRPSASLSSITVSEIKIRATATNKKIKPKDVDERVRRRLENPERRETLTTGSNDTSIQSPSLDFKTKFITQGWLYNPSLNDVQHQLNAKERSYSLQLEKKKNNDNSQEMLSTYRTKARSNEKLKITTNAYVNKKSSRFSINSAVLRDKLTKGNEANYTQPIDKKQSQLLVERSKRDAWYNEIQNQPYQGTSSEDSVSQQKENQQEDPKIEVPKNMETKLKEEILTEDNQTHEVTSDRFNNTNQESVGDINKNVKEIDVYQNGGKEELYYDITIITESIKSYPWSAKSNLKKNEKKSAPTMMAQSQIYKPDIFQSQEHYPPNELEISKCEIQKQALLSNSPGYGKQKYGFMNETKDIKDPYIVQNNKLTTQSHEKEIIEQSIQNKFTEYPKSQINKEDKEKTYGKEEKKDNSREKKSLKEDLTSYIDSLEDIVSTNKREKHHHGSSYRSNDHYDFRNDLVESTEANKKYNHSNKKPRNRSESEDTYFKKSRLETIKYTENKNVPFVHQQFHSFSETDRYDRFERKSLHRSSSEEPIFELDRSQQYRSDDDRYRRDENNSQAPKRKETFDFTKYIKLNKSSSEELIYNRSKDQENRREDRRNVQSKELKELKLVITKKRHDYAKKKPLYRTSSEEIYKHLKENSDNEKTLEYDYKQVDFLTQPKKRKNSKYEQFYQSSSDEFIKRSDNDRFNRGQSEPRETKPSLQDKSSKEMASRENNPRIAVDKNKTIKKYWNPIIISKNDEELRNNTQNESFPENITYKNAEDDSGKKESENKLGYLPISIDGKAKKHKLYDKQIKQRFDKENKSRYYDYAKFGLHYEIFEKDKKKEYNYTDANSTVDILDEKQRYDAYSDNVLKFEKLRQAIMSKCNNKDISGNKEGISSNVKSSKGLSDEKWTKWNEDVPPKQFKQIKQYDTEILDSKKSSHMTSVRNDRSNDLSDPYSTENNAYQKSRQVVDKYSKEEEKNASSDIVERIKTYDPAKRQQYYRSSSEEEISTKNKTHLGIEEDLKSDKRSRAVSNKNRQYPFKSNAQNEKEDSKAYGRYKTSKDNLHYRSSSEDLASMRGKGFDGDDSVKDKSPPRKNKDTYYPTVSERLDKYTSITEKRSAYGTSDPSKKEEGRDQSSSEDVISNETQYQPYLEKGKTVKESRAYFHKKRKENKRKYEENSKRTDEFIKDKLTEENSENDYEKSTRVWPLLEKSELIPPNTETMSKYEKLRQAIMSKCNQNQTEDLKPPKAFSNAAEEEYYNLKNAVLSKNLNYEIERAEKKKKRNDNILNERQAKPRAKNMHQFIKETSISKKKHGKHYNRQEKTKYQPTSEGTIYSENEAQEMQEKQKQVYRPQDSEKYIKNRSNPQEKNRVGERERYRSFSDDTITRRGESPNSRIVKSKDKNSMVNKKHSDHDYEESLKHLKPSGKMERKEILTHKQHLQSSSEEVITGRVPESPDSSRNYSARGESREETITKDFEGPLRREKTEERSVGISEFKYRREIHERQKDQQSLEEIIIRRKTKRDERANFSKDVSVKDQLTPEQKMLRDLEQSESRKKVYHSSSEEIIIRRRRKLSESPDKNENEKREIKREYTFDSREPPLNRTQYQLPSEEIISQKHKYKEKQSGHAIKIIKEKAESRQSPDSGHEDVYEQKKPKKVIESRDRLQDKTQYGSFADQELSDPKINLNKYPEYRLKKLTKDRLETKERIVKKHGPQTRGPSYDEGTPMDQIHPNNIKETTPERERLTRAMSNEIIDALIDKWSTALYDEDLKSKLERQREALFSKCPGYETEGILKRDNTLSYRYLIKGKIKLDDESQYYDQNKMQSRSTTKERATMRRTRSLDRSSSDELKKYDSQIGALFSKSPGFTKQRRQRKDFDDDLQSYRTRDRKRKERFDYDKNKLAAYRSSKKEDLKNEVKESEKSWPGYNMKNSLHSSFSDEVTPKPKTKERIQDHTEEKETKKRHAAHDPPLEKPFATSEETKKHFTEKIVKNRPESMDTKTDELKPTRQQHRSSSVEKTLKQKVSEPLNQKPLPSFSDLGDWHMDLSGSRILTEKSKGSADMFEEKVRNRIGSRQDIDQNNYRLGKDDIEREDDKSKGRDISGSTIQGKRKEFKDIVDHEEPREEGDKSICKTTLQEEKDKNDSHKALKGKKNKDIYIPDESMGSIIDENKPKTKIHKHQQLTETKDDKDLPGSVKEKNRIEKYSAEESIGSDSNLRPKNTANNEKRKLKYKTDNKLTIIRKEYSSDKLIISETDIQTGKNTTPDDFQEKRQTIDKTQPSAIEDRREILNSEIDSAGPKEASNNRDRHIGQGYSEAKLDETKDFIHSSGLDKLKIPDLLSDSIKSKDTGKDADNKKDGKNDNKLAESLEIDVDNLKDSKILKDSAKLVDTNKSRDSKISKQYDEDEGFHNGYEDNSRKQNTAKFDGTELDYAKYEKAELLAPGVPTTGTKGGKQLDLHGVPLEAFEELREQELRVINQRADSREEPDRQPTRMLSVPSAEKSLAHSTKDGQKGKEKVDANVIPGKLGSRKVSQDIEEGKIDSLAGKRTSSTGSRRPSQDIEEEKVLVVERIPLDKEKAREYKEKHKDTPLAVVKLEEFEALVTEVNELEARMRPASRFSFPGNAEMLEHIRNGASLTEAMAALQLSARIEAAENALENIIEMVSKLAAQNPDVDIDKYGQPVLKTPMKREETKPIDYLGLDQYPGGVGLPQKVGGAKCREGCITKPEFDSEISKVQKELAKEIGECAKKNLTKIDVLAKNLRHLESKVEDAVLMSNRISDLEDKVSSYSERINAMDTGLSVQMTSYQDQLTQMQHELEEGLENMAETLANAEGDPAAVAEFHAKLNTLQDDLVNTANIQSELEKNEHDVFVNLKDLFTQIENLRETKADREEVEDALQNKAGLSALNGLISLEHFDALLGDMEAHIGKAYDKFNNQELIWQKAINDLVKELNEKTNLEIVLNLRDDINSKLNMMMERINSLRDIVGEPKAFGVSKRINVGAECLSCKTPAQMEPEAKPSRMQALKSSPASAGEAIMKEAGDACYPGFPIPHPLDPRTHICNRYCGGSHTVLKNVALAKSLPGALTIMKWEKPMKTEAGSDGKAYLVEDPKPRGPCKPCNIKPSVSTLDISPKPSPSVKGKAVFDIEIRESGKCPCFNVEPELDSDVTLTG